MNVFQIILLINLCISVGYFITSMIILKLSGINPIGKKVKTNNGYNYKVDTEAKKLEEMFGDEWDVYCKNVGKYLPKLFSK